MGFWVEGFEFRIQGSGFGVQGLGFRTWGSRSRVQGSGFGVQSAPEFSSGQTGISREEIVTRKLKEMSRIVVCCTRFDS